MECRSFRRDAGNHTPEACAPRFQLPRSRLNPSQKPTEHAALEAQVQVITDLRRDLRYAADTVWPAGKKNAATRTEFKIPPNKGMK